MFQLKTLALITSNLSPIFIVRVRQGQNTGVPFADYRLDLSNPERPVISFVREGVVSIFKENNCQQNILSQKADRTGRKRQKAPRLYGLWS